MPIYDTTIGGVPLQEYLERELRYPLETNEKGCLIFTGGARHGVHGSLFYKGESWQAHRLSFTLVKGAIPIGMKVLHECDIGRCIHPYHLFLGTQTDNIADMDAKGRSNRPQPGEKNGRALISSLDVIQIRQLYTDGMIYKDIAEKYKLSVSAIARIITRQSWSHV